MRILLAHNSPYYPSLGGGDKSNRLLMEALAAKGHSVRVATRVERFGDAAHENHLQDLAVRGVVATEEPESVRYTLGSVDVRTLTRGSQLRAFFSHQIEGFDPEVIVCSTDDPAHILFDLAMRSPRARVVYLARATIAVPFGPDSSSVSSERTAALRQADGVVCVSEYVARYVREWGKVDAVHLPISLFEGGEPPLLGRFDSPFVLMVNPCAVKGVSIVLDLAAQLPHIRFGAVPSWGTTQADLASLRGLANMTLLGRADNINDLLRYARITLVPSLWAEARSRIVPESLARGVPVIASDAGGIREAMLGLNYLLPVRTIARYRPSVDEHMVPVAEIPPQDTVPWHAALERLWSDQAHWEDLSRRSREAGLAYLKSVSIEPFEHYLIQLPRKPRAETSQGLSADRRRLLEIRLKRKTQRSWFPCTAGSGLRLFCFPYAGAGALAYRGWSEQLGPDFQVCPAQLPGRETRIHEPPFTAMEPLIEALAREIGPLLDTPFGFFGHSMGAGVAFELARRLVGDRKPVPRVLIVSAARAPRFRALPLAAPLPSGEDLLARLGPVPPELAESTLRALRADVTLYSSYVYQPGPELPLPIIGYGGDQDPDIRIEHLDAWREQTARGFRMRQFPGGHLYFAQPGAKDSFLRTLAADLRTSIAQGVP